MKSLALIPKTIAFTLVLFLFSQSNLKAQTYYTLNQVNEAPKSEQIQVGQGLADYVKMITNNIHKNVKGNITLTYVVDAVTGETEEVEIEKQNLTGTQEIPEVCETIATSLRRLRWTPAKLNGKAVSVKNEITIQF